MSQEKKTILIADDDPGILDALKIMLEEVGGYQVDTTMFGESVLQKNDDLPDLILLDLWMSGIDGREICEKLKSNEDTKHIPVMIFSANKDIKHIANSVGADDYLPKPFQMKELLAKVEKHLNK